MNIRLGNVSLVLDGELQEEIADEIRKTLSYVVPGHEFMARYKQDQMLAAVTGKIPWDGTKTVAKWKSGNIVAPTGLFSYIREIFQKHNIQYTIMDERPMPVSSPGWSTEGLILRDYQEGPCELALNRQRGVIQAGTGCHAAGQGLLMFDGSIKKVEDIVVGDLLMGPDSTSREVLALVRGKGRMVRIIPTKGTTFDVNEDHVLTLVRTNKSKYQSDKTQYVSKRKNGEIVDVKVSDYLQWSKKKRHLYKLFRPGEVKFRDKKFPLDPYLVGLFIGDGCITNSAILSCAKKDVEIEAYYRDIAKKYLVGVRYKKDGPNVFGLRMTNGSRWKNNAVLDGLKELGLFGKKSGEKFVPFAYKTSNKKDRLEMLAGLLDTDGSQQNKGFDFVSKSNQLAEDVAFLARSCGLAAYVKPCFKGCQNGYVGKYFRVSISGETSIVPCKLERKKSLPRKQKKSVLRTGFSINHFGEGSFYGFTLNKDGRYLLDDFTVTHNSGKTPMMVHIMARAAALPAIFYVTSTDLLIQAHDYFSKYMRYNGQPTKIGIVGGGHFDLQPITICTIQTAEKALTGIYTKYKFDDYDAEDDATLNEKQRSELNDLIRSCQCFVMDEAHHTSCDTIQTVISNSHAARYRFGMSASPWRDDGLDILIEAAFGRKICEISSSFLINKGHLVPPTIIFNHFTQALGPAGNYNAHYTRYVVENDVRNRFIAQRAIEYSQKQGLPTIILVKWAKHANILADIIKDCEVLTSSGDKKKNPKKRKLILDKMRSREVKCIIATTLLDEGVDVPSASVGIFAGGGKSSTRALQRVGRFIRPDPMVPGKQNAIIEEFWDHTKWLMYHAKLRRKIYQTEERYVVEDNSETLKL